MIKHFKDLNLQTKYDIIIVGAGAAGITIALEFLKTKYKVALLESGKLNYDSDYQKLMRGTLSGSYNHHELDSYRLRQFGGTTNIWGAGVLPFDKLDFQERKELKLDGWPIKYSELERFYEKSKKYVKVGSEKFLTNEEFNPINREIIKNKILIEKNWLRSKSGANFKELYFDDLKEANNIDVFLETTLTDISIDKAYVNQLIVSNINQGDYSYKKINSKKIILSCGGIETTRLLLNFNNKNNYNIGNYKNALGRYYSPHINIFNGTLITRPGIKISNEYYDINSNIHKRKYLSFSEEFIKNNNLLNFKSLFENYNEEIDKENIKELKSLVGDNSLFSSNNIYSLNTAFEQTPCYTSDITLIEEKDPLGLYKVNLNFDINKKDLEIFNKTYQLIGSQIGFSKLGFFHYNDVRESIKDQILGSSHHTGSCRIITKNYGGSVDENLRVYGTNNMYIASSAVFPSPSHANPTFTIIALSIRLAELLKKS